MLSMKELRFVLALQRVNNLGDISAKKLISIVGSAEGIFKEKTSTLLKINGIGRFKLKELNESHLFDAAEEELDYINAKGISFSYFEDKGYPEYLKHCVDGPILFFHHGNIDLGRKRIISVVGTRNVTQHGRRFCEKFIEELSPLSPVIVSGFAYGVDITAHKTAMKCGLQTIACLAHGFNQIYPKTHKRYVNGVKRNGGFISEFWSSDSFDRNNFLKRNRIIAGISQATVVIESARKGGSLVTADIANSYNREVFAIPGRPEDLWSQGCNDLIKSQKAQLITNAAELIYLLGWELEEQATQGKQARLFVELTKEEKKIYNYLFSKEKQTIDSIAIDCEIPTHKVASLLLNLELKGVVQPLSGKYFRAI